MSPASTRQTRSTSSSVSSGKHGRVSTSPAAASVTGRLTCPYALGEPAAGGRAPGSARRSGRPRSRSRRATASRSSATATRQGARRGLRPRPAERARWFRGRRRVAADDPPAGAFRRPASGSRTRSIAACISSRRLLRPPSTPDEVLRAPSRTAAAGGPGRRPRVGRCDDRAAVAERAEVLGRVEAEGRDVAERAGAPAGAAAPRGLRAVLDEGDPAPLAQSAASPRRRPADRRGG